MTAARSYRDVLSRTERKRPDGSPVWPIRPEDRPSAFQAREARS